MRVIVVMILLIFLYGFIRITCNAFDMQPKYKTGDIIYLKPDSTRVIVTRSFCDWVTKNIEYHVMANGRILDDNLPEELIYESKN